MLLLNMHNLVDFSMVKWILLLLVSCSNQFLNIRVHLCNPTIWSESIKYSLSRFLIPSRDVHKIGILFLEYSCWASGPGDFLLPGNPLWLYISNQGTTLRVTNSPQQYPQLKRVKVEFTFYFDSLNLQFNVSAL